MIAMNKEILEGNKLIAEFVTEEPEVLKQDLKRAGTLESMQYHESWDWLMPVVEKIHNIFESEEDDILPYIYQCEEFLLIRDELGTGRLPESWSAVVDFIKWYNENNPTNDSARINR